MVLNFWTTLFLIAAGQGLFLAVVLLSSRKRSKPNYFLSFLVFLFSVNLACYVFFWSGITAQYPLIFNLVLKIVLLFGPVAYLYVNTVKGLDFKPKDLRHFYLFPFVTLLSLLPFAGINQTINGFMPFIECGSLLFYSILIARVSRTTQTSSKLDKFISQYAILFSLFTLSYVSYYVLYYANVLRLEYDYAISLSMAAIIYFIGYRGYFLPELYSTAFSGDKYEKSGLSSTAEQHYADKILRLMNERKLYSNNELRLQELAKLLGISAHHTSQVINSSFNQSFSDFVNRFRIDAAKEMMNSDEFKDETLIGIAYLSGFNNKVSFNNAFQKFEGVSPGNYRKSLANSVKYHPVEA